jgi:hypothetical protein
MRPLTDLCCVVGKLSQSSTIQTSDLNGPEHSPKQLELMSKASRAISDGDLVDRMIHGSVLVLLIFSPPGLWPSLNPISYHFLDRMIAQFVLR